MSLKFVKFPDILLSVRDDFYVALPQFGILATIWLQIPNKTPS